MNFLPEALDTYVVNHSENEPELLQQLTRETIDHIFIYRNHRNYVHTIYSSDGFWC
uniref:hypothetical protein n=1 Tax=Gelidibacter sp. TaxID=2018083 RepID=UPI00404B0A92